MDNYAELSRRLENLIRFGTIAEVDPQAPCCRVKSGGLLTDWIRWFALRAGEDSDWDPPSEGEQCILFSPSGDPAVGVALVGLYSDQFPAPDNNPKRRRRTYRDGAVVEYDTETHALRATLPAGGRAELHAPGGVAIVGDVEIDGTVSVSRDVLASGISLVHHRHPGDSGGTTGAPQ